MSNKNIVFVHVYIHFIHINFDIFYTQDKKMDRCLLEPYTETNLVVMTGDIGSSTLTLSALLTTASETGPIMI